MEVKKDLTMSFVERETGFEPTTPCLEGVAGIRARFYRFLILKVQKNRRKIQPVRLSVFLNPPLLTCLILAYLPMGQ
jgi:hypothetical protein